MVVSTYDTVTVTNGSNVPSPVQVFLRSCPLPSVDITQVGADMMAAPPFVKCQPIRSKGEPSTLDGATTTESKRLRSVDAIPVASPRLQPTEVR